MKVLIVEGALGLLQKSRLDAIILDMKLLLREPDDDRFRAALLPQRRPAHARFRDARLTARFVASSRIDRYATGLITSPRALVWS
jgi:hypothetical protein